MNIPKSLLVWVCTIYLRQGRFPLCYHGDQEGQLDLGSHWYHLFQVAQLVLEDPRTTKNTNNMVKVVYQIVQNYFVKYFKYFYMIYHVFIFSSAALFWDGQLKFMSVATSILTKKSGFSLQLGWVRSFSYPCTWSSWTSNWTLWTQGTLWKKGKVSDTPPGNILQLAGCALKKDT